MSQEDEVHPITELMTIVTKAGIGLLPGGGFLVAGYEAVDLMSRQAAKQMERRAEKRYGEFISNVFKGEVSPEVTEFLTADDYHALLNGCMADMENEKAKYYGRLTAAIGRGEVKGNARRFLILTLTQISESQLQMLRKSFIAVHHQMRPKEGAGNLGGEEILEISDAVHDHEYKDLKTKSLYIDGKLSSVAGALVRACFEPEELTPKSIGKVEWHPDHLDIIFDSNEGGYIEAIGRSCWQLGVHCGNRHVSMLDKGQLYPSISPRVMLMRKPDLPLYLPELSRYIKSAEILFVDCHGREEMIRKHYPNSTIIHAEKLSYSEVADEVMACVKPIIGR